jgi:hypothetical protein
MDELTNKTHSIDQVGIVVKDLEKIKLEMKRIFGLDPVDNGIIRHKGVLYRGKPATCGVHIIHYFFLTYRLSSFPLWMGRAYGRIFWIKMATVFIIFVSIFRIMKL